ncbi:MAG: hypothetical protein ACRDL0_11795, partial [Thermoleophilaceae bacterium]
MVTASRVVAAALALGLVALVPLAGGQGGQQDSFDRNIHLVSRVLVDPGIDPDLVKEIRGSKEPVHAIVQLESLPRTGGQDLETLRGLGIRPLSYLNGVEGIGTAYLASVSPELAVDDPSFGELVRGLQRLLPADRV